MVTYIRSDLEFILDQIKIAEQHAAGTPLFGPGGLVPAYNVSFGLRTVDGTYNHLLPGQEQWGAADVQFPALVNPEYAPGYTPSNNPASVVFDPSLRTISNLIVDQTLGNPAAILEALARGGASEASLVNVASVTAIHQAFTPASDAEYQARVALQNAEAAANTLSDPDLDPQTPLSPEEQAALDAAQAAVDAAIVVHDAALAALETARGVRDAALVPFGIAMDGDNVHLPNTSPDVGLSASFNSWFTLFGQFFDHGLDLVEQGRQRDRLHSAAARRSALCRRQQHQLHGADARHGLGRRGRRDGNRRRCRPVNTTTSYVDQNQTYASHASHQVFLRQYEVNAAGDPVATGRLIEGGEWRHGDLGRGEGAGADARHPAAATGRGQRAAAAHRPVRQLHPERRRLCAGRHHGLGLIEGDSQSQSDDITILGHARRRVSPWTPRSAPNHAFLADIAHNAVPNGIEDGDITRSAWQQSRQQPGGQYDDELARRPLHGGRRPRQREYRPDRGPPRLPLRAQPPGGAHQGRRPFDAAAMLANGASQADAVAFLNEWLADDVAAVPNGAGAGRLRWCGMANACSRPRSSAPRCSISISCSRNSRARSQPQVDAFIVPDGFDTTINPTIVAEFAHVVYRFGHSMLTGDRSTASTRRSTRTTSA
jgi:hypothetical protein